MNKNCSCCVILLAAGKSSRFKGTTKKQFYQIKDKTLLEYCLETFASLKFIKQVIITINKNDEYLVNEMLKNYKLKACLTVVYGGKERYNSVTNSLKAVNGEVEYVLIHDVARPLVSKKIIISCLKELKEKNYDCVVPATHPVDTVKIIDDNYRVVRTLDRDKLVLVQTPQVFKIDVAKYIYSDKILYKWIKKKRITDDAQLAELEGFKVKVIIGDKYNLKVTTKEDIDFINFYLNKLKLKK